MNRDEGMASFTCFLIGSELTAAGVAIGSHGAAHLPPSLLAGSGSRFGVCTQTSALNRFLPRKLRKALPDYRTFSVDDAAVQQHVEAAEKIVNVLDGSVFADRNPHEVHELGRAIALEQHAARATLVHQLVRVPVGILDHVVMVAVVDHLHHRPRLPGKAREGHLTRSLRGCSLECRSRSSE